MFNGICHVGISFLLSTCCCYAEFHQEDKDNCQISVVYDITAVLKQAINRNGSMWMITCLHQELPNASKGVPDIHSLKNHEEPLFPPMFCVDILTSFEKQVEPCRSRKISVAVVGNVTWTSVIYFPCARGSRCVIDGSTIKKTWGHSGCEVLRAFWEASECDVDVM